ncbi:MAG TPA: hypothetical protein V6C88_15915 [Chroococcidiopsis sp.]
MFKRLSSSVNVAAHLAAHLAHLGTHRPIRGLKAGVYPSSHQSSRQSSRQSPYPSPHLSHLRTLLLLTVCLSATLLPTPSSLAQSQPDSSSATARTGGLSNLLADITSLLARDEPPLGSRGTLCLVSPGLIRNANVWSDRPLFVWQEDEGSIDQIIVRDFSSDAVIWQAQLNPGDRAVTYGGPPLQAGQLVIWELSSGGDSLMRGTFELIAAGDRTRIETEVDALEQQLKTSGASTATIAAEQARYFAGEGLWSDTIQTLYSLRQASPDIANTLDAIIDDVCPR